MYKTLRNWWDWNRLHFISTFIALGCFTFIVVVFSSEYGAAHVFNIIIGVLFLATTVVTSIIFLFGLFDFIDDYIRSL